MTGETSRRPTPQPVTIGGGFLFVYAGLALIAWGAAGWLIMVRKLDWQEPAVFVSAAAGFWFLVRALMQINRRK